jgi:cell wall-associated NlpC family hydrolase
VYYLKKFIFVFYYYFKGEKMNRILTILWGIIFLQFLIFLYIKLVYEKTSQPISNGLISEKVVYTSNKLPQSTEFTNWDEKSIETLNKKISKITKNINTKSTIKSLPIAKNIELYAKEKLGKQYVWGATGPNKFDCSGFTREVFQSTTGITIPRVSKDQAKIGTYVKYQDLQQGDMVFFDTEKKYTGSVNHVGIYLSDGTFIHASSARKKVIMTNFKKKPFYKKRFLWGRRVVNTNS